MSQPKKKIAIIDDELGRSLLAQLLEDDFEVLEVTLASTALNTLRSEHPDMLLIEPTLPTIDCYELIRRLLATDGFQDMPVIAITAARMPDDEERADDAGCKDFILKPIDEDDLRERMGKLLGG